MQKVMLERGCQIVGLDGRRGVGLGGFRIHQTKVVP